jgi:alpha-beta hydrolase superfamily lysophospholipase
LVLYLLEFGNTVSLGLSGRVVTVFRNLALAICVSTALALTACSRPQLVEVASATAPPRLGATHYITRDGEPLAVSKWTAPEPRAVIVALHGFNEYAGDFRLPAPWFSARGVSVYAFDQRGFGRTGADKRGLWAGGSVMAEDLKDFVDLVRLQEPGLPVFVLGTSMGGAVAMKAAASSMPADGLILVAPAIWGWRSMNPILKSALWVTAHTVPDSSASASGMKLWPSDNIDWLKQYARDEYNLRESRFDTLYGLVDLMDEAAAAAPDISMPVLYLYGKRDEIVPEKPTRAVMANISAPTQIIIYENGFHMLLHDRQRNNVYRDILYWIEGATLSLPAGSSR